MLRDKWYTIKWKTRFRKDRVVYKTQDRIKKMRLNRAVKALSKVDSPMWAVYTNFRSQDVSWLDDVEAIHAVESGWAAVKQSIQVRREALDAMRAYDARRAAAKAAAKAAEKAA